VKCSYCGKETGGRMYCDENCYRLNYYRKRNCVGCGVDLRGTRNIKYCNECAPYSKNRDNIIKFLKSNPKNVIAGRCVIGRELFKDNGYDPEWIKQYELRLWHESKRFKAKKA